MSVGADQPGADPTEAVTAALERQAVASGGFALGPLPSEDQPPWATELMRQFNDAGPKTQCPHLRSDDQPAVWMSLAPDLLACFDCRDELVTRIESRLGHSLADEPSRCSVCGERAPVRGVSLAAGRFLLRGLLCAGCGAGGDDREGLGAEPAHGDHQDRRVEEPPTALNLLGVPWIRIDFGKLQTTEDRTDFDELGLQFLGRAGRLGERLIGAVERELDRRGRGLELDEAVV